MNDPTLDRTRVHRAFRSLPCAIIVAVLASAIPEGVADEPSLVKTKSLTADDACSLVEKLVNHNPAPEVVLKGLGRVRFDPKYDWDEYRRVWKSIEELVSHAEEAWPELVRHLDDQRYCTTFDSVNGVLKQWTVGEMCREIIGRNLAAAYYQHLKPPSLRIYGRYRTPEFPRDAKKLKSWCEERSKKPLYELQIEECEWIVADLKEREESEDFPGDSKHKWIATITKEIDSLRASKKAVPFKGFGTQEFDRYSAKTAPTRPIKDGSDKAKVEPKSAHD